MTEHFDIAIAGSTPLAGLLAGIIAREHGAKVCWIGRFPNPMQPQRGFDLSVGALTRPETWDLLMANVPEVLKHLSSIGDGQVYERVDPLVTAQTAAGADALAHMRATAQSHGIAMERQPVSRDYLAAFRMRDAMRILRRPLCAALPVWLEDIGVTQIAPDVATIKTQRSGSTQIALPDRKITADHLVLSGDGAISAHLAPTEISKYFEAQPMSAVLMEPVAPLAAPVILEVDSGTVIYQRSGGTLDCVGRGDARSVGQSTMCYANSGATTRLAGVANFDRLISHDGGAVVGKPRGNGATLIAGLGLTGLFQAPALARIITDNAAAPEQAYFAKRAPIAAGKRSGAAEFQPAQPLEVTYGA